MKNRNLLLKAEASFSEALKKYPDIRKGIVNQAAAEQYKNFDSQSENAPAEISPDLVADEFWINFGQIGFLLSSPITSLLNRSGKAVRSDKKTVSYLLLMRISLTN